MINYILPGLYEHFETNIKLIDLKMTHPEYFYENTNIYSVYGSFQHCIFDGGRIFNTINQATSEDITFMTQEYNKRGIKIRLVFTNNQLQESDYYDRFGNVILSICHNNFNEIVVADNNFKNYIKNKYPLYNFVSSTTKCLNNIELLEKELDDSDYIMTCLDYNLNKNKNIFNLSDAQKQKCEILVNAICGPGCPNRKKHYRLNSIYNLNYGQRFQMEECRIHQNTLHPENKSYANNLSFEDIKSNYEPYNFSYFKLEGRTWSKIELICAYADYLIKPEYKLFFINLMMGGQ